jgi:hypothetical protein
MRSNQGAIPNKFLVEPKMSLEQAQKLWNNLSPAQKAQFNAMLEELREGKLMLQHVGVDDNEVIQNIVLEQKDKMSKPTQPFAKYFKQDE